MTNRTFSKRIADLIPRNGLVPLFRLLYGEEVTPQLWKFHSLFPLRAYEGFYAVPPRKAINLANKELARGKASGGNFIEIDLYKSIDWEGLLSKGRSYNFHVHSWDMLEYLLTAYHITRELRFLNPCLDIALAWIDKFPNPPSNSTFAWYDMAVGLRAYRLAYILDAIVRVPIIEKAVIAKLTNYVQTHASELANEANIKFHNNHGIFQVAGQLALSRRLQVLPGMEKYNRQAKKHFRTMLKQQFSDEGIHLEHSPDYAHTVHKVLSSITQSGLVRDQRIISFTNKLEKNLAWFITPSGHLARVGDSDGRKLFGVESKFRQWRSSEMKFINSGGKIGKLSKNKVQAFDNSGYFIVRDPVPRNEGEYKSASYLLQMLGFHSRVHKHADDLSFIWYDRSKKILVDAGRYGYVGKTEPNSVPWKKGFWYSDPNRMYVESTRAHNTVEIDGESYERRKRSPYGSALLNWGKTDDGIFFSESEVKHFHSIRHVRVLFFLPREWLIVFDWLWDNKEHPHDYRQWFHFSPEITVEKLENQYSANWSELKKPLRLCSLVNTPIMTDIFLGESEPRMQGWSSPSRLAIEPNPALAFEVHKSPSAIFSTLFTFSKKVSPVLNNNFVSGSGRQGNFAWLADDSIHQINFSRSRGQKMLITYNRRTNR